MKQTLTRKRSVDISVHLPSSLQPAFILLVVTFITPATHSAASLDLSNEHHRAVVEELKSNAHHIMGASYNSTVGVSRDKMIRNFYRDKYAENADSFHEGDMYISDTETHVFHSTDADFSVPAQPANTSLSAQTLTVVSFNTNLHQPEIHYHDLVIQSAILRLRIKQQKAKIRRRVKTPLTVTFYLVGSADHSHHSGEHSTLTKIHTETVNNLKSKAIEIDLGSQLLSHIVDSENKIVTFGVRVEQPAVMDIKDNEESRPNRPLRKNKGEVNSQSKTHVRVSKLTLQLTSQTKNLRRKKRQHEDTTTCTDDRCCRHSIYIDFEEIGWSDWVLYPAGYTAYYCKGGCPYGHSPASSFTSIKNILHEKMPEVIPEPVCAPTSYDSLEVDMESDGMIKTIQHPFMVVTGCRCH